MPTLEDYVLASLVRARGRGLGIQLGLEDCLIGAVAKRLNLPVITGNTEHFEGINKAGLGIILGNWRVPF